jgi:hypothetical protein
MTPKGILRASEARIKALQSEGLDPGVIVMIVLPGRTPALAYVNLDPTQLAFAATRLQLSAMVVLGEHTEGEEFENEGDAA